MAGNGYDDADILLDAHKKPIPQYFNTVAGTYKPITQTDGPATSLTEATLNELSTMIERVEEKLDAVIEQLSEYPRLRGLRGLASEKPAATAENRGWTYWSVDTGIIEVSTGSSWVFARVAS